MDVSKNSGTPKWMVYNGSKPYKQMDDLGGNTTIFENTHIYTEIYVFAHLEGGFVRGVTPKAQVVKLPEFPVTLIRAQLHELLPDISSLGSSLFIYV